MALHPKTIALSCALCLLIQLMPSESFAQSAMLPRNNYDAFLEPNGKVINIAGQSNFSSFQNYWNVMSANTKPAAGMIYFSLNRATSDWIYAPTIQALLNFYAPNNIVLQIGLSMTQDGNPSAHYEQDVANGLYDSHIDMFLNGLAASDRPAYVRIGYEFNGSWNGYSPATYKAAYQRIVNKIRASGLPIANVWNYAADTPSNYMDFYPGDNYVDWWGVNIFDAGTFGSLSTAQFMNDADAHHKPVMLGEETPRYGGVLDGQSSWDGWFNSFFNFIHNYPGVKAFSYINRNWSGSPQWSNWGDARLEMNSVVAGLWNQEMTRPEYLHAQTNFLGSVSTTPPAPSPAPAPDPD